MTPLLALGCGDPISPESDFVGTYHLASINGQPLPYVVAQSGPNTVAVTSDILVVADGGSWSEVASYRLVENGVTRNETTGDGGTWVRTGSTLSLYSGSSTTTTYAGVVGNGRLTFNDPSFVQVFVK